LKEAQKKRSKLMKVLVCGGRFYLDYKKVKQVLDAAHKAEPIKMLIHGGARGADTMAGVWAEETGVQIWVFEAEWGKYGKRAGYLRNKKMLDTSKPDLVIAFPGGRGTEMMVDIAQKARVRTVVID
jgi:hypothetical protein